MKKSVENRRKILSTKTGIALAGERLMASLSKLLVGIEHRTVEKIKIERINRCFARGNPESEFDREVGGSQTFRHLEIIRDALKHDPTLRSFVVDNNMLAATNLPTRTEDSIWLNLPTWQAQLGIQDIQFSCCTVRTIEPTVFLQGFPEWRIHHGSGPRGFALVSNITKGVSAFFSDQPRHINTEGSRQGEACPDAMILRVFRCAPRPSLRAPIEHVLNQSRPPNVFDLWIRHHETPTDLPGLGCFKIDANAKATLLELLTDVDFVEETNRAEIEVEPHQCMPSPLVPNDVTPGSPLIRTAPPNKFSTLLVLQTVSNPGSLLAPSMPSPVSTPQAIVNLLSSSDSTESNISLEDDHNVGHRCNAFEVIISPAVSFAEMDALVAKDSEENSQFGSIFVKGESETLGTAPCNLAEKTNCDRHKWAFCFPEQLQFSDVLSRDWLPSDLSNKDSPHDENQPEDLLLDSFSSLATFNSIFGDPCTVEDAEDPYRETLKIDTALATPTGQSQFDDYSPLRSLLAALAFEGVYFDECSSAITDTRPIQIYETRNVPGPAETSRMLTMQRESLSVSNTKEQIGDVSYTADGRENVEPGIEENMRCHW